MNEYPQERLVIKSILKRKDANGHAYFRIGISRESKGTIAVSVFSTNVFDSADTQGLYNYCLETWNTTEKFSKNGDDEDYILNPKVDENPAVVWGAIAKVAVDPHHYFSRNKQGKMVIDDERTIGFVRLVALETDTIENQKMAYIRRVPSEAWIKQDTADAE